jgi:hypothetical protein
MVAQDSGKLSPDRARSFPSCRKRNQERLEARGTRFLPSPVRTSGGDPNWKANKDEGPGMQGEHERAKY